MIKKKSNQGFSLVELLIAITILVIIMVALASFMGSTTKVYTRTRNDIELQRSGQSVYELIADKLMQASEVRIGRDGKEYAMYGTNDSDAILETGHLMKRTSSTPIPTVSDGGKDLYAFSAMDESDKPIDYICIRYEYKDTIGGGGKYREAVDCYYFKDNKVYLVRNTATNVRSDSVYSPAVGEADYKKTTNDVTTTMDIDDYIDSSAVTEDDLISSNFTGIYGYAIPDENAIYLTMNLEKQSMEQVSQGMVTIRNSYVLQPRKYEPVVIRENGDLVN